MRPLVFSCGNLLDVGGANYPKMLHMTRLLSHCNRQHCWPFSPLLVLTLAGIFVKKLSETAIGKIQKCVLTAQTACDRSAVSQLSYIVCAQGPHVGRFSGFGRHLAS